MVPPLVAVAEVMSKEMLDPSHSLLLDTYPSVKEMLLSGVPLALE